MNQFTGLNMLKIDIANCFGMDKENWIKRISWVDHYNSSLEDYIHMAEEPLLYMKAVKALRLTEANKPSGHSMFLDATASGLQIMAALSGCKKTARHVNMINTGNREDVYTKVANNMNIILDIDQVDRSLIKKPVMTHYYNKMKQDTLSLEQQAAFYQVLANNFEGAEAVKDIINNYWDPTTLEHKWTLPDGHIAKVKVTEMINARIEVDELDHTTFTYRFEANMPSSINTSLTPNIIHSIDAYIAREMIRRSYFMGFELAHIHDAFCAHPNNMPKVQLMYKIIMAEIADSNLLEHILSEISNTTVSLNKYSSDLSKDILASEYMLS